MPRRFLVCRPERLGGAESVRLHSFQPDDQRCYHYGMPVFSDQPDRCRPIRPFGRAHWGIENKLHWTLDVAFREDYARNRKDHSAANLAVLRKITLNLIRLEPTEKFETQKFSLGRKRMFASYNPDFLLKILLNL